jgi:hypothetical protein
VEDEIWRPGYDGPTPVSAGISFDRFASTDSTRRAPVRRPWRLAVAASAVGAMMLVAVVVIGPLSPGIDPQGAVELVLPIIVVEDDRWEFSSSDGAESTAGEPLRRLESLDTPFAGTDLRRLPTELAPLWTTEVAQLVADGSDSATTWVEAVDDRYVVVGIGDARTLEAPAAVLALDASSGERLWANQVESRIDQVEFVAAIDDVLVLTINTKVLALDLPTGSELWSGRLAKVGGPVERIERLEGTDLLAVMSSDPDHPIRLIEPRTGATVGEMAGDIIGTDHRGRWYVLRGDKILEFDLVRRSDEDPSNGRSVSTADGELVGAVDSGSRSAVAVVDGSLVTTLDEMLAVGPLEADGERITGTDGLTPLTIDLNTPEWVVLVRGIIALGGSAFATVGGGTVSGAEVIDGSIRFAWQRRGTVTADFATERGVVLLVGTNGGAAQTLVDGSTGETIASLTMSPGLFDALEVVGTGIVTRRTSRQGLRIAGLDLDGNELWALDGSIPVSVGKRIVVQSTPQADGSFEVTAYGSLG